MQETIRTLVQQRNICVLATAEGNKPHCSLMAYIADEDCRTIYLATHRSPQKYRNLVHNPHVSLLIDTRGESQRTRTKALTVAGVCETIDTDPKRSRICRRLLEVHPHLKSFLEHPEAVILGIQVVSFLLLDGLTQATYEAV